MRQAPKYHNIKTRGYDSAKEAERARVLHLLEKAGKIRDLREQVRYELIPAQWEEVPRYGKKGQPLKPGRKCVERALSYTADFVYVDCTTGETIVEDTKGFRTSEYICKRKLMRWIGGIAVKEV